MTRVSAVDLVELVRTRSPAAPATKRDAHLFARELFAEVARLVTTGQSVYVPELGIFKPTTRKARNIRNPVTGEMMRLPRTRTVRLAAAKALRAKR